MGRGFGGKKRKRDGSGKGKKGERSRELKGKGDAGGFKRRGLGGPAPQRAVLVTSGTPSQCPKATREATRFLESALEALRPAASEEQAAETAGRSIGESLEAELQALRGEEGAKPPKRPIRFHSEVSRGVALLSCPGSEEDPQFPTPSELVSQVFAKQRQSGADCSAARFVVRMAPLDYVCSPHLKNFQATAAAVLPKALAGAKEGAGWYCAFHGRAMTTITRQDVLTTLKEVLAPLNLDLSVSDAEYMIVIEVNPVLCGFSVLQGYEGALHECNLQKACREFENRVAKEDEEDDASDEDDEEELDEQGDE
eukprot:TRINITY_DN78989_c0_g1_i1.p1 TRINITY_DN78989_c0_g1~~TRINITY_DN78989_c0_g1_i1.p1  ORF type:complete len:320 (-),score=89.05 TRINITY_DN78989_c0_g1_i1:12-944(-)